MAGDKYLIKSGGYPTEKPAPQTSGGAGDAGKLPALDANGKLDNSFMPTGVGAETIVLPASENLAAGDLVNIWDNAGAANARKADASGGTAKQAHGFVLAAVTAPANATVYLPSQQNNQVSGMTPGATQYLSASSPGARTETEPTTATHISQIVGTAASATNLLFNPKEPIVIG